MTTSLIYTINDPAVIYEEFGDEIVAVNLDTGIYYSLRGSAYEIWLILKTDASTEEVLDALLAKYPKHVDKVTGCIPSFIEHLISLKLIREILGARKPSPQADYLLSENIFIEPQIDVFSDMQDILLLDPVHDVDDTGWPVLKNQKNTEGN